VTVGATVVGLAVGAVGATVVGEELVGAAVGPLVVGDAVGGKELGEAEGAAVVGEFVGVCSKQRPRRISKKVRGAASRQLVAPDGWGTRLGVWTRPYTSPR
jgi:hypothetical protein